MKRFILLAAICCISMAHAQTPYTSGIFILNEDWYGHENSTINHLSSQGQFSYRIIREENKATCLSLGGTSSFGTIYGDRFYFICKQENSPGNNSQWKGGRVVVTDAKTMKVIYSIPTIFEANGVSAADGRAFVGVDETKGYIGTDNGIFVLNLTTGKIGKRITGTENPLLRNSNNKTSVSATYYNQIGTMLRAYDYVFAIQQDKGIHIINPETDEIITTIAGCFSTMVQSKDGRIWAARNTNRNAQNYPYGQSGALWQGNELLCINPVTLEQTAFNIARMSGIQNLVVEQTWYAWTAGSLCASTTENALFFSFNPNISDWYNGRTHIYRYDIDDNAVSEIFDVAAEDDLKDFYIYNSGIVRVSPHNGNLYVGCFHKEVSGQNWIFLQLSTQGELVHVFKPIEHYWYPSLFIFPDMFAPEVKDFTPATVNGGQTIALPLKGMATDKDNMDVAITKRVLSVSDPSALSAVVRRDTLFVTALANVEQSASIAVRFNSNGQTVDKTLSVNIRYTPTAVTEPDAAVSVHTEGNLLFVSGITQPAIVSVFDMTGRVVSSTYATGDICLPLPQGIYIVRIGTRTHRIIIQ